MTLKKCPACNFKSLEVDKNQYNYCLNIFCLWNEKMANVKIKPEVGEIGIISKEPVVKNLTLESINKALDMGFSIQIKAVGDSEIYVELSGLGLSCTIMQKRKEIEIHEVIDLLMESCRIHKGE